MKMMLIRCLYASAAIATILAVMAASVYSAEDEMKVGRGLEGQHSDQIDAVLAKLSDEQVREMLSAELSSAAKPPLQEVEKVPRFYGTIVDWLHIFDSNPKRLMETRVAAILGAGGRLPGHFADVFVKFGKGAEVVSAVLNVLFILVIFAVGFLAERCYKALTPTFHDQTATRDIPQLGGYMRFWAGSIRMVSTLADLVVFAGVAVTLFLLTPLKDINGSRYLFLAILFASLVIRFTALFSNFLCSPNLSSLRLLAISDSAAERLHRVVMVAVAYVIISLSCIAVMGELGMPEDGVVFCVIASGSFLLIFTGAILLTQRRAIAEHIISTETVDNGGKWVTNQFASVWHIPALLYLFFLWAIFLHHQIMGIHQERSALLLSLLFVPIFLILDRLGHWIVEAAVKMLKVYQEPEKEVYEDESGELLAEEKEKLLIGRFFRGVRVAILIALLGWILHLWGYRLPYISIVSDVVFRSLITMALALLAWRIIAGYIEKKLLEEEPDEAVEEDQDSEWGSSALRGRAYTLLPMVRKFIGTALVIMVTLTLLSTMGVEIGPLLAGAGVLGLAIGFGAQKLVSDVFSGFFFLLDDAFRVGEYLDAGGVSGAVEGITLRNVLLRHHRGMLQIVPYSELGSITNYMRGGIVVKFNLEFPYDTDIDLVRREIKKVGISMLKDEDFGRDFIFPVKSQGVREITNSVMVIRVKFTAQPGTHFVIRREAYRRITEALAAKGIYYAHRKVIVELPENIEATGADRCRFVEAGAAADLAANSLKE